MTALLILLSFQDPVRWVEELDADSAEVRGKAESELMDGGDAVRGALERAAGGEGERAIRARRILRWLEIDAAIPPVVRARFPEPRKALRHPDPEARRGALFSDRLAMLLDPSDLPRSERSLQGLFHALLSDPDPALRLEIAVRTSSDADGRAAAVAIDFLRRCDDDAFRRLKEKEREWEQLVEDAAQRVIRTARAGPEEIAPLLKSPHERVRAEAVRILGHASAPGATRLIRSMLEDSEDEVVAEALRALGRRGEAVEAAVLMDLAKERSGYTLMPELYRALVKTSRPDLAPSLAGFSRIKEGGRGAHLFRAAVELDPASAREEAVKILRASAEGKEGRRADFVPYAVEALGRLGDTGSLDLVLAALRVDGQVDQEHYGYDDLRRAVARCVTRDRIEDMVQRYFPADRDGDAGHVGSLSSLLVWGALRNLDADEVAAVCARRALDPKLPVEDRRAAAQLLGRAREDAAAWAAVAADAGAPVALRRTFLGKLPWTEPDSARSALEGLGAAVLRRPGDPLRDEVAQLLVTSPDHGLRRILLEALDRDDSLAIPVTYEATPRREQFGPLLARRLRSPDPAVAEKARGALAQYGPCGLDDLIPELLVSGTLDLRRVAAMIILREPRVAHLPALRAAAAREPDLDIVATCMGALQRLGDREGLRITMAREFPPGSVGDRARMSSIVAAGTREEILALEGRFRENAYSIPPEAIPAIAKADPAAGARLVRKAIAHPFGMYRAAGAQAIRECRLAELLPELRSMALCETPHVRGEALLAVGRFGREERLRAFRAAMRSLSLGSRQVVSRAIVEDADPELAREVYRVFEDPDPLGFLDVRWSDALDACLNGESRRAWSRLAYREEKATLEGVVRFLRERGVRVSLSEPAAAFAGRPLFWSPLDARPLGARRLSARPLPEDGRREITFATVSAPEGVRLMLLEEARAHWRRVMR